jgi:nucleoprotein TPR
VAVAKTFCIFDPLDGYGPVLKPTVDLVNQFPESITAKVREFDEPKSAKPRLEVELENAVRSSESRIKVLESSVERA